MKPIELNTIDLADKKASLGPGIELLMNDKKKDGTKSPTSDINISDLTNLVNDLDNNEYLILYHVQIKTLKVDLYIVFQQVLDIFYLTIVFLENRMKHKHL